MSVNCLICGRPTAVVHLGIDACRACTVFYRRTRKLRDRLTCVNGDRTCRGYLKRLFSCRKCRLDRFEEAMKAGNGK
ncbi:hypothetical protein PENTCL1PPCAC_14911, partial [Pristionchus entomophagus]